MIVRPATAADLGSIASIQNALLATTTIEWTDAPHTAESLLEWMDEHDTVLVAEERGEVARLPELGAKFGRWLDLVLLQLRLDDRTAPPER